MSIDVTATVEVGADPQRIWDFMTDPQHEPEWIGGLRQARLQGDPPLREGSRVERLASFLGKRIEYVNEVTTHDPPHTLEMHSVKAPFPMQITYTIDGRSVTNHVRGGGARIMAPFVRRNIRRDLRTLKRILESPDPR
jgi:Polyketide cyclase / dehydrase and lipid transport